MVLPQLTLLSWCLVPGGYAQRADEQEPGFHADPGRSWSHLALWMLCCSSSSSRNKWGSWAGAQLAGAGEPCSSQPPRGPAHTSPESTSVEQRVLHGIELLILCLSLPNKRLSLACGWL